MKSVSNVPGIVLCAFLAAACSANIVDEHMVVEGWIEDGGYPEVYLTSSVAAVEGEMTREGLASHVLTMAAVSVSDGSKTVFLTGVIDNNRFPPYYYTTTGIKGEPGKTYTLNVKYGKTEASAVTTVPQKQELDGIALKEGEDGVTLSCRFNALPGRRYKFFTKRKGKDPLYSTSFLSMVNGDSAPGSVEVSVNRGYNSLSEEYKTAFEPGDTVSVRFSTMDAEAWDFWQKYEDAVLFSHNPMIIISTPVEGNVKGAYGSWSGYGSSYYEVVIPALSSGAQPVREAAGVGRCTGAAYAVDCRRNDTSGIAGPFPAREEPGHGHILQGFRVARNTHRR